MSITLVIPTWKQVSDVIFLVVAYYSVLVAPQYDWLVFGVAYYFGVCVALRSWWRMEPPRTFSQDDMEKYPNSSGYNDWLGFCFVSSLLCLAWVLAPLIGLTKFLVTAGNSRKRTEDGV